MQQHQGNEKNALLATHLCFSREQHQERADERAMFVWAQKIIAQLVVCLEVCRCVFVWVVHATVR